MHEENRDALLGPQEMMSLPLQDRASELPLPFQGRVGPLSALPEGNPEPSRTRGPSPPTGHAVPGPQPFLGSEPSARPLAQSWVSRSCLEACTLPPCPQPSPENPPPTTAGSCPGLRAPLHPCLVSRDTDALSWSLCRTHRQPHPNRNVARLVWPCPPTKLGGNESLLFHGPSPGSFVAARMGDPSRAREKGPLCLRGRAGLSVFQETPESISSNLQRPAGAASDVLVN